MSTRAYARQRKARLTDAARCGMAGPEAAAPSGARAVFLRLLAFGEQFRCALCGQSAIRSLFRWTARRHAALTAASRAEKARRSEAVPVKFVYRAIPTRRDVTVVARDGAQSVKGWCCRTYPSDVGQVAKRPPKWRSRARGPVAGVTGRGARVRKNRPGSPAVRSAERGAIRAVRSCAIRALPAAIPARREPARPGSDAGTAIRTQGSETGR